MVGEATTATVVALRWRAMAATLVPVGWFVAMGISARGNAPAVMAVAVLLLGLAVFLARGLDLRLLVPTPRNVAIGVAAAALMVAGTYAGFHLLSRVLPAFAAETSKLYTNLNGSRWTVLVVTAVVIGEEILWRGAFQSFVALRVNGTVRVAVVCSVAYAVTLTSFGSPLLVIVGLACGLYWSTLRSWSGSVVVPLVAHVVWDVVLALMPLQA